MKVLDTWSWQEIADRIQELDMRFDFPQSGDPIQLNAKKTLRNKSGKEIAIMKLVGVNEDRRENGLPVTSTWLACISNIQEAMREVNQNIKPDENNEGYQTSDLRSYLNDYLFYQFPEDLQNNIVPVKKEHRFPDLGFASSVVDRVWIPSTAELDTSDGYFGYSAFRVIKDGLSVPWVLNQDNFTDSAGKPCGSCYWLRDSFVRIKEDRSRVEFFGAINESGERFRQYALESPLHVSFGFCI